VYSLGVVLLEVGLWEPLKWVISRDFIIVDQWGLAREFLRIVPEIGVRGWRGIPEPSRVVSWLEGRSCCGK
jgi:hypothetical protein